MEQLIKSTSLNSVRLMDFFQVMSNTVAFLKKEDLETLQLQSYADQLEQAVKALDQALLQGQKTGYTDEILATDELRDNLITGIAMIAKAMQRYPEQQTKEAAKKVQDLIKKYGKGIIRLPQREETAVVTNLIQDLKAEENKNYVQTIAIQNWVEKLEQSNKHFEQLYNSRTEKEAEFITGLTRTERERLQKAFDKLCQAINAYAFINGQEKYKTIADKINKQIAKAKTER